MTRLFNPNKKLSAAMGVVLLIAALVLLNMNLYVANPPCLDVSSSGKHKLSQVTLDTISAIKPLDPITIDFYYTPDAFDLPLQVKKASKEIVRVLDLYRKAAGEKLDIQKHYFNPLSDDRQDLSALERARSQGIKRFEKYWNQDATIIYCGLVVSRAGKTEVFDHIDEEMADQLEFKITSAIDFCISAKKKTLGIISSLDFRGKQKNGRDGKPVQIPEWEILSRLKEIFDVRFLEHPAAEVKDCDVLLVVHPRGLSERDYRAIDQHVMQGKGALFCESPFSFQELILLSQQLEILDSQYNDAVGEEAQEIRDKAERDFLEALKKTDKQAYSLWKAIKDNNKKLQNKLHGNPGSGDMSDNIQALMQVQQAMMQQFQQQLMQNQKLIPAAQARGEELQRAELLTGGRRSPRRGGKAERLRRKTRAMQMQLLPPADLNERLLRKWGVHLLDKTLLFLPSDDKKKANMTQFNIAIGGAYGNPGCIVHGSLETQELTALYPSFVGVLEQCGKNDAAVYQPLVRADKQFSFFVPNSKSRIGDWYELSSLSQFVGRQGRRYQQWQMAMSSEGDQLLGWCDVAVALEGKLKSAFAGTGVDLSETAEGAKSRVVVIASTDILEISAYTDEDRRRQRNNHDFLIDVLKSLSLSPKVAALSKTGAETDRFDALEDLAKQAQQQAEQKRRELETRREQRRLEAEREFEKVKKKYPMEKGMVYIEQMGLMIPASYPSEEQRQAMAKAEQKHERELEMLNLETKQEIERIEYEVTATTAREKDSIRLRGTFFTPCMILLLGLMVLLVNRLSFLKKARLNGWSIIFGAFLIVAGGIGLFALKNAVSAMILMVLGILTLIGGFVAVVIREGLKVEG